MCVELDSRRFCSAYDMIESALVDVIEEKATLNLFALPSANSRVEMFRVEGRYVSVDHPLHSQDEKCNKVTCRFLLITSTTTSCSPATTIDIGRSRVIRMR